tara:strand:- start:12 stop:509 length:498 start_codon:yes stop_codon:yes gene_type:complete
MRLPLSDYFSLAESGLSDDEIFQKLATDENQGDISKMLQFAPILVARTLFGDLGVTFQDDYYILDKNGSLVETGNIQDNSQFFNELRSFQFTGAQAKAIAFRSSEAHALNNALNAGSSPSDLVMAPPVVFLEQPTELGMQKAQQTIQEILSNKSTSPKKAWWKFW